MDLRTTASTRVAHAVANLQSQTAAIGDWQEKISSSKRLERPSQGPSDFVSLIDYKARDLRLSTSLGTISDATNDLNEGVSHLTEAGQVLTKAHALASDGANAATDGQQYEALASEVEGLLGRLIDLGNAKVGGRYLFGGTATTTQPFAVSAVDASGRPAAVTYQGTDERSRGIVGPGQTVDTIYAGGSVFQATGADAFQTLIALRDNLRDPSLTQSQKSAALNQRLSEIDTSRTALLNTVGEQASALENLDALTNRIQDVKVGVQSRVSELEGTDFAEAAVKFQEQQNALKATLAVTAKIFDGSLLDFIR